MNNVTYRRYAITAAEELGYGRKVIDQIKAAKNDAQISQIMASAREREVYDWPTLQELERKYV